MKLVNYQQQGNGPDIILINGLFGSLENLNMVARALASSYRVTSIDVRNHGQSFHLNEMSYQSLANDIGVSKQAFYGWISGETLPKRKYISQIYKVMDCSQTELKKALKTNFDRQEQVLLEK